MGLRWGTRPVLFHVYIFIYIFIVNISDVSSYFLVPPMGCHWPYSPRYLLADPLERDGRATYAFLALFQLNLYFIRGVRWPL